MKTRMLPVLLVAAVLCLSGCVQMQSETTIEADGSGTTSMQLSLSQSVSEAIKEMQDMDMDMGQDMEFPDLDKVKKEDLEKAAEGHGVQIKKFSQDKIDGRDVMSIEMSFKDLKGFSYVMNKVMGEGGGEGGLGIFDAGDGNFVLREAEYDFPADEPVEEEPAEETPAAEMDPAMLQKQIELMGKLMGAMAEMDIQMVITVPGDIIASSAPTVEGRTSKWVVNSSNMMTMQNDMTPEITFSGKGLTLKPTK